MAGRHFCVSFSDKRDAETCLKIGQSVLFDNGAFSLFTKGKQTDWTDYIHWLEDKLGPPHWAIIPDVIDGTLAQQKELLAFWPYPAHVSAPVWHLADPIYYLIWLAERFPRICFGSSGDYWQPGTQTWENRIDEAFQALCSRHLILPWVHMLRAMNEASHGAWPFASADSTNVARNFKRYGKRADSMAEKLDARQPSRNGRQKAKQEEFAWPKI